MRMSQPVTRVIFFFAIIVVLSIAYVMLTNSGAMTFLQDGPALKHWFQHLGLAGPLIIIALMVTAVVMSPIPSAPIALAAGAAYGHTFGTLYVATGSELGAILAFFIARLIRLETLQQWVDSKLSKTVLASQNALMSVVFVSRLLPFVSFDMVSYAAGVTPLRFWRFAVATLAGIIPASFLLAHFGAELTSGESKRIGATLLLLAIVSLVFVLSNWFANRSR